MNHAIMVPILLPLAAAAVLILLARRNMLVGRCVSALSTLGCLLVALLLANDAFTGAPSAYALGNWPAPFGIVLVSDRLSSLLLVLTDVVALCALLSAVQGVDLSGRHFHGLFQFQLVGIHGAFLTGDLFNLFVFFEILLIASYCLLLHGGGEARMRSALHYVILNLIGSTIFLVAIGTMYGVTGALNMAHIAERIRELGSEDAALVRVAGLLALVVFGLKAALLPFHFWLPRAYPSATAPVAALFAIMSKVGVYCIVRVATLMFGPDAGVGAFLLEPVLIPVALATQLVAILGALGSRDLRSLSSYLLINSVGVMVAGIGLFTEASLAAALYYLLHSTVTVAALFLLADHVARARGGHGDLLRPGPVILGRTLPGVGFIVATLAVAGIPPLSGFLGKAGILLATPLHASGIATWAIVLSGGFLSLVACVRAGSTLFWDTNPDLDVAPALPFRAALPWLSLLSVVVLLTVLGGRVMELTADTASQLLTPTSYMKSVLPEVQK